MLSQWATEQLDELVQKVKLYYHSNERGYFSGANKIEDLIGEKKDYFLEKLSLSKLTGLNDPLSIAAILQKGKLYFANYLLNSSIYEFDVNAREEGRTAFELLIKLSIEKDDLLTGSSMLKYLFMRGYDCSNSDLDLLKIMYKEINSQQMMEFWCLARFSLLLDEASLIAKAFEKQNILFTIISFKLKKPVGINYPNLLGIANNAFLHYRAYGEILIHAMKVYNVYDLIIEKDRKKTFKYRLDDYHEIKPIQDTSFNDIIFKIFPELKIQDEITIPQTGQNL